MTIEEFILLDKAKVRRDSNLMSLYLEFFQQAFNKLPNCAGCSFGTDWQKLVSLYSKKAEKKVTLQKGKTMNTITIKKIQGKILTYRKDGKTYRQYDNILTDSFIKEFIVSGTEEENKERVKMFNFPAEVSEVEETKKDLRVIPNVSEENRLILNEGFTPAPTPNKSNDHKISESSKQKRGPKKRK